jgi:NADH-quinone oxidoreductase subunit L
MTAFYMFRLMAMTFFGAYRGPAWETSTHGAVAVAAEHGAPHPADPHAHGQADLKKHEVTHGPADSHQSPVAGHQSDDHGGGHGHGPWHGPHESPAPMTFPLQALAVGAIVAGFVGIPAALGGSNTLEHFLEPAFTAEHRVVQGSAESIRTPQSEIRNGEIRNGETRNGEAEPTVPRSEELGLMLLSVLIAAAGIGIAYKFYVTSPEISDDLAERFAGPHRVLENKYYVDELYNATVISGTFAAGDGLWAVDRNVVDGAVNGTGWITVIGAWFSGLADRTVVDGLVNLVGRIVQESSLAFRRLQSGLVQNYALVMLFGIFVFVSIYLFAR